MVARWTPEAVEKLMEGIREKWDKAWVAGLRRRRRDAPEHGVDALNLSRKASFDFLLQQSWKSPRRRPGDRMRVRDMQRINATDPAEFHRILETDHTCRRKKPRRSTTQGPRGRREFRDAVDIIKAITGCSECREMDPACLDFHHRDPSSKEFCISMGTGRPWDVVLTEIEKCDVLCSNCHRKHTRSAWDEKAEEGSSPQEQAGHLPAKGGLHEAGASANAPPDA